MSMILRRIVSRSFNKTFYTTITSNMAAKELSGVSLQTVITILENFAPKELSESWDNTGLLVEPYTDRPIRKVILTNDLTLEVALEAVNENCEMIISYHPPIFAPLKSVVQKNWKESLVSLLLEKRIALYSPHTSWDSIQGGVNDWLGSCFDSLTSTPIIPSSGDNGAGRILKLKNNITLSEAVNAVKKLTGLSYVRLAKGKNKSLSSEIKSVALCAGSGASVLKGCEAELYLTGEMLHHDVLDATQKGISIILTNHSDSERGFLKVFAGDFASKLDNKVSVIVSEFDKDPLTTV